MIHVCNNYIATKVHKNLIEELAISECQYVIVPIRKDSDKHVNRSKSKNVCLDYFRYPNFLKWLPLVKVIFLFIRVFFKILRIKSRAFVVAHNIWSDGVPVFLCSLFFGYSYSVSVRGTDIKVFLPKLPHYRWIFGLVIGKSSSLVFISEAHRQKFLHKWPDLYRKAQRVDVIPNGVDQYWHDNIKKLSFMPFSQRPIRVVYTGRFLKVKNLRNLYAALLVIRAKLDVEFVAVGGTELEFRELCDINAVPEWVTVINWINGREQLSEIMSNARVFAMPSITETFGISYVEALCSGCSVIHSFGEGIDGFFNVDYIRSVDPFDLNDIADNIKYLLEKYPGGTPAIEIPELVNSFDWAKIAHEYVMLEDN